MVIGVNEAMCSAVSGDSFDAKPTLIPFRIISRFCARITCSCLMLSTDNLNCRSRNFT